MSNGRDPATDPWNEVQRLREEVRAEHESERLLLERLLRPGRRKRAGDALALFMLGALVAVVLVANDVFFLVIAAVLLLYSYNFIIILLPTTTETLRPGEQSLVDGIERDRKWLAVKLLAKNRRLAVDIGLTVFLCGMAPLVLGFSLIFGLTIALAAYLGFVAQFLPDQEAWSIVLRVGFILLFYGVVVLLQPRSQAASGPHGVRPRGRRSMEIGGTSALFIVLMALTAMILVTTILGMGSTLIPIVNLGPIVGSLNVVDVFTALGLAVLLVGLAATLRHFQATVSRKMAVQILEHRLARLEANVLDPLDRLEEGAAGLRESLDKLKREYYGLAIYDIGEHDLFGRSPVFLVGPRLRYVLDDRVLSLLASPAIEDATPSKE